MATSNATSSPRDHAADANPDIARKKQRFTEEGEMSAVESPRIEISEPEVFGASFGTVIRIHDEPQGRMEEPYGLDFCLPDVKGSAWEQLVHLEQTLKGHYIELRLLCDFTEALIKHIDKTQDQESKWKRHYVEDEAEFFNKLADVAVALLNGGDILDPKLALNTPVMREALTRLLTGLETLAQRIILLLPDALKSTSSRRDSAQITNDQQRLGLLRYLVVAQRVLTDETPTTMYWVNNYDRRLKLGQIIKQNRSSFSEAGVRLPLSVVIRTLSGSMRDIKDSWQSMQCALELFQITMLSLRRRDEIPTDAIEEVMDVIKVCVLPTIREKHPNALPPRFHVDVVQFGNCAVLSYVGSDHLQSAWTLYERFIWHDTDAILSTSELSATSLLDLCNDDSGIVARMLATSWTLQAYRSYICSEIMNIRYIGIEALRLHLIELFHQYRESAQHMQHPVIQYAARFMKQNKITEYIFGPESRAGLVSHTGDIIAFFAATRTYTDHETDTIWHACSTSVESDLVKASTGVLRNLLDHLDFRQLLHLTEKYSKTPIDKMGVDVVEFLPQLLKALETRCSLSSSSPDKFDSAVAAIDILKHANAAEQCASTDRLRECALAAILRFNEPGVPVHDRLEMYKRCIPDIVAHSPGATSAIEVLGLFLMTRVTAEEAEVVIAMLPVRVAVEELCAFVQQKKQGSYFSSDIESTIRRLDYILRLMAFDPTHDDQDVQDGLFDHTFGEAALCDEARDAAWIQLTSMSSANMYPTAAKSLRQCYLRDRVPLLSATLATPKMVELVWLALKADFTEHLSQTSAPQLFAMPLWSTLTRIATGPSTPGVRSRATDTVMDLLFVFLDTTGLERTQIAHYHALFVRGLVKDICAQYEHLKQAKCAADDANVRQISEAIGLLIAAFSKSKATAALYAPARKNDELVLGNCADDADCISFVAQIYGAGVQQSNLTIRARPETRVAELLDRLHECTSRNQHRIIAGGREVSHKPDQTLHEAGVRQSGVTMIVPQYTYALEPDALLTCPGPTEEEILRQYSCLEKLLGGPESIARVAFALLSNTRPSAEARSKVVFPGSTADEIFPPDKPWRTMLSIDILKRHLYDFSKVALVDGAFVSRAIDLLTDCILDDSRSMQPALVLAVVRAFIIFLRGTAVPTTSASTLADETTERATFDEQAVQFRDEEALARHLIGLLSTANDESSDAANVPSRIDLTLTIYKALMLAVCQSPALWKVVERSCEFDHFHKRMLLDNDPDFSAGLVTQIKNICQDNEGRGINNHMDEIVGFYWQTIIGNLEEALRRGPLAGNYFGLAVDVLHANVALQANEPSIRCLVESLIATLWSYKHDESIALQLSDRPIAGLLRLLCAATTSLKQILKASKDSLNLQGFPARLMREFLFSMREQQPSRLLVQEDTRALVYDLIRLTLESDADFDVLLDAAREAVHVAMREPGVTFPGLSEWVRPPWHASGLRNLGMTCYMNSLLQQLFANVPFRKFVLDQNITEPDKQRVLRELQGLFARMQNNLPLVAETAALAQALNIEIGNQEDVHTFYTTLLSVLEHDMPTAEQKQALTAFFTGKSITQVKGECGHVSSRTEAFTELSITVKNKASLLDSLDEFVQGEPLEGANKYKCMTCAAEDGGRLVDAMRRTCLEEIPNSLTLCLKRFTYESMLEGENKVNDRFEFPPSINLARYKRAHLDHPGTAQGPDTFELVGVIVHQGSLQFGHYWSYVRVPGSQDPPGGSWMCLEDGKYARCMGGISDVQEQCFGGTKAMNGNERADSAYVLCYQRTSYIAKAGVMDTMPKSLPSPFQVLPRVDLPADIAAEVENNNRWQQTIALLFSHSFHSFVPWLLNQWPTMRETKRAKEQEIKDCPSEKEPFALIPNETDAAVGDLFVNYVLRILLAEPSVESKISALLSAITPLLEASPAMARSILGFFAQDEYGFAAIVRHGNAAVRVRLFGIVEKCMSCVHDNSAEEHDRILPFLLEKHAALIDNGTLNTSPLNWGEYLSFAAKIAQRGHHETGLVLENGYLTWVLQIINLPYAVTWLRSHAALRKWMVTNNTLDVSPLFNFLAVIFSEHVDLSEIHDLADHEEVRSETSLGWCLRKPELDLLAENKPVKQFDLWLFYAAGSLSCVRSRAAWQVFAPGKALGPLLSSNAHVDLLRFVEKSLLTACDYEDNYLDPLLLFALHFCQHREDTQCKALLRTLGKNIVLWEGQYSTSLWFLEEAYKLAPAAVVESIPIWAQDLLRGKTKIRESTLTWLSDHVLAPPPLSENPALDASRIRSIRLLFGQCELLLSKAYGMERSRTPFESMMKVMIEVKKYLLALGEAVKQRQQQESGPDLDYEILVEYNESRTTLMGLTQLLENLSEWESEPALPTRLLEIRRSVEEMDSDDQEEVSDVDAEADADAELDDLSSEQELL